jgi:hypothetical protein
MQQRIHQQQLMIEQQRQEELLRLQQVWQEIISDPYKLAKTLKQLKL